MTRGAEADATMRLALGRILRLLSRPFEPGDVAQYENARAAFYAAHDEDNFPGTLAGFVLTVTDRERACELLTDAANSADDDKDPAVRDALTTLCARLRRAELTEE